MCWMSEGGKFHCFGIGDDRIVLYNIYIYMTHSKTCTGLMVSCLPTLKVNLRLCYAYQFWTECVGCQKEGNSIALELEMIG